MLRRIDEGPQGVGTGRMDRMQKPANAGMKASRNGKAAEPLGSNSEIARKLKQYYDELVSEEIPDRFSDLLSRLEHAEQPQRKD